MSGTVDNRVVTMQFDNSVFETKMGQTLDSLNKLTKALEFQGVKDGFGEISKSADNVKLDGISAGVDHIAGRFSAMGALGLSVINHLTQSAFSMAHQLKTITFDPIATGGRQRALNIEQAKFQFRGLGIDVDKAMQSALDAVKGTAYGLDEAAKIAAQFGASGIKAGDQLTGALRGVAGAAAMTGSSFSEIGDIFAQSAATGKVNNQDLQQFATRGLNAAAAIGPIIGKTEAQVHEMASKGTLDFKTFADAMDKAFGKHATQANETFTGALANMHAAMSRIGAAFQGPLLNAKRDTFNTLTYALDKVKEALGPIVDEWTVFTRLRADRLIASIIKINFDNIKFGIAVIAKGLGNIFHFAGKVGNILKFAFRSVFPSKMSSNFISLSVAFEHFTEKLKPSGKQLTELFHIFRGFFSAISIGVEIIKNVGRVIGLIFSSLAKSTGASGGGVLGFFSRMGTAVSDLKKKLVDGKGIEAFFLKLIDAARNPAATFDKLKTSISNFVDTIKGKIPDVVEHIKRSLDELKGRFVGLFKKFPSGKNVENSLGRVGQRAAEAKGLFEKVGKVWDWFVNLLTKPNDPFKTVWTYVKKWFAELWHKLGAALKPGDFKSALDAVNTLFLGGIILLLNKFLHGGLKIDFKHGFLGNISNFLKNLSSTLQAMQVKLKSEAILKIAEAVGVLAVSLLVLSLIDSAKLTKALLAISVGFGQLILTMAALNKVADNKEAAKLTALSSSLVIMAGALLVLSLAITVLSRLSWSELERGLVGIGVGLGLLVAATILLDGHNKGMIRTSIAMVGMSIALILLSVAVRSFSGLSWTELAKGLGGVAVGLGLLVGATLLLSTDSSGLISAGIAMTTMSLGLTILSRAVKDMGSIDLGVMAKGLIGVGIALAVVTIAMNKMPSNIGVISLSMIAISVSLLLMTKAISSLGSLDMMTLVKGIGAVALILAVLAVATNAMDTAALGAGSILIVSFALSILAGVLKTIGDLSIAQILTAIAAIAAVLIVIGLLAAAATATGIVFAMAALGAALILVGAGIALVGAGVYLLGAGLERIAKAGDGAAKSLLGVLKTVATALPSLGTAVGAAIVNMASSLLKGGDVLARLFDVLLGHILDSIIRLTPKIFSVLDGLIHGLIDLIISNGPGMIEAGFLLLMSFLQGLNDHIQEIVTLVSDIITNFLNALADNLPQIVDAASNLIVTFLNELGNHIGEVIAAGIGLILQFMTALGSGVGLIVAQAAVLMISFIGEIGAAASGVVTAGANTLASFVTGLGQNIEKVVHAGFTAIIKFLEGVSQDTIEFVNHAADVITHFLNGLATAIRTHAADIRKAGLALALAIADAVTGGLASKVVGIANGFINSLKSALGHPTVTGTVIIPKVDLSTVVPKAGATPKGGNAPTVAPGPSANTPAATDAGTRIGKALAAAVDLATSDMSPTITPVLDLSNIKSQAGQISGMIGSGHTIVPEVSSDTAKVVAHGVNDNKDAVDQQPTHVTKDFKFEQNIYAPKALSTAEIYRQQKSQIALARKELLEVS